MATLFLQSYSQYGISQYGISQYGLESDIDDSIYESLGFTSTITTHNTWNQYDEFGLIVGLSRLVGEKNAIYKRRIIDVFTHRANSSYQGLIHAITRELGLSLFTPIQINPRRSLYDGRFFAPDPYIKFDGVYLYLYSDYSNSELDYKIDRFEPGGNYEYIGDLVDFINSTTYFEASMESGFSRYIKSMTILNQSNRELVAIEDINVSTKFRFKHDRIVNGSIEFSNSDTFKREVNSENLIIRNGDYYINYNKGMCTLYTMPLIGTTTRYQYNVFPFKPIASEIIINDINNDNFKVKMFEQILQEDGTYVHGKASEIGVDIINELMSVTPLYFGV